MTLTPLRTAAVGWGMAVPEAVLTNHDLAIRVDTSDEWIVERTGIRERRIAGKGETTATLAVEAGRAALADAGVGPEEVDILVVATATPEQPLPATAAFVQHGLGLGCGAFDLGAACAGFVYSMVVASSLVVTGGMRSALVIGSETLTRIADPLDRATVVLFGDGAGAVVLAPSPADGPGLLAWDLRCDGSAADLLEIPAGGSARPTSAETVANGEHWLKMRGSEVFRRAVRAVVDSATVTLERAGVSVSDVALFAPHQANGRIIEAAARQLGIGPERTAMNIDRYGNTSAASIPIAVTEAARAGRLRQGDLVLMSGVGAGLTWASALLSWGRPG